MRRSWEEIDSKIRSGSVTVITAEEMTSMVAEIGTEAAFRRVDVVTTGTFSPMCSSGVLLNTGHQTPRTNYSRASLNGVPAYSGLAAVDLYLGATSRSEDEGSPLYGGGHVIEELVSGGRVRLEASGHGTDCYPGRGVDSVIGMDDLGDALLLNPRNCYQNYNVAVNASSDEILHTYMGPLLPDMRNAAYSSAGQLSPLLNDPHYRTVGIGTRVFLGGGMGYVTYRGTQHQPRVSRTSRGIPREGAGTLTLMGDLKTMSPRYLRGVAIKGYGVSLAVGVGMAIPVLDQDLAASTGISDADIPAPVVDYSSDYPNRTGRILGTTDYARLRSGRITVGGREMRTMPLSSYAMAREIAVSLRDMVRRGSFTLTRPSAPISAPASAE